MRAGRGRQRALLGALALSGVLVLTGCQGDDADDGAPPATPPSAPGSRPAGNQTAAPTPTRTAAPTPAVPPAASAVGATATATPAGKPQPKPKPPAPGATCDHTMPISPDEVAVNRYTPEGGFHSLIVRHGNWGCGAPGTDGAPFETVGKETFIPIAADAEITAVTPIVASTENQKITLQQLIDWLVAHPDQGLVFRYHLGADVSSGEGPAIDTLHQVFTP
ncbi:hypothetical protein ACFWUW_18035 [Streptomyces sp. NPDC058655]|uniref:hypothetical protein n=1 Tax=Streptomyces sp. NPDC058655 TaxID=3346577 RepID=UPI0036559FC2